MLNAALERREEREGNVERVKGKGER